MIPQTLPHDLEAERAVLGSVLLDPKALDIARRILQASDFYSDPHQRIWRALVALADAGSALDLLTLRVALIERGDLERCGGPTYLAGLLNAVPTSRHIEHYGRLLTAKSQRRAAVRVGYRIVESAGNGTPDANVLAILAEAQADLKQISFNQPTLPAEDLADVLGRPVVPTPWAIPDLLAEGDVAILSGPGGIGKTWIALATALSLALGHPLFGRYPVTRPYRVAILDLESRPWETDLRLHRLIRGLGLSADVVRGRVQIIRDRLRLDHPDHVSRLLKSLRSWGTQFLTVDSFRRAVRGDINRAEVVAELFGAVLDRMRLDLGCGVLVIDHTRKLTGEVGLDTADQSLIGSVDKRNAADAHFGIGAHQEHLTFTPTKTRHSRLPEPILLDMEGLDADADPDGPVTVRCIGSVDRASDRVQDAILALLEEAGEAGVLRGEIIGRCSYSKRAVTDGLSALMKRDKTRKQIEGKQARYFLLESRRGQRGQTSAPRSSDPK